jgi:hypothetical protein
MPSQTRMWLDSFFRFELDFTCSDLQGKILVRSSSECLSPSLNAVAFSGQVYGDTRMDTNWALRQAYAQLIRIISLSSTIFSTDTTRRARSKESRTRTVVLLLRGSGLVWVTSLRTCNGRR